MPFNKPQIVVDPTELPGSLVFTQNKSKSTDVPFEESQKESAKEEGKLEATKQTARDEEENVSKLDKLLDKSTDILLKIRNIVPIFTSEMIVDSTKVTVIHRPFFFSERIHSVSVQDISDVYIDTVPFFATIYIVDTGFVDNVVKVRWVWKPNAEKARRIITGLIEAAKKNIDVDTAATKGESLAKKLEEIGKVREATTTVSGV